MPAATSATRTSRPLSYPLYLYQAGFSQDRLGYANAMAIVLFIVTFLVILLLLKRSKSFTEGAS